MISEKQRVLGSCKAFAKKQAQYIPAIGWAWKFAEYIFLERSFEKKKQDNYWSQVNEILDHLDASWVEHQMKE